MAIYLRQSSVGTVRIGPFVDVGDGFTPEVLVTVSASDEAEVLKAGGVATVAMPSTVSSFISVAGCDGWYDFGYRASDVDTVGELVVVMQDDSVYLPVHQRFYVVEEAVYDDLYAASADPFTVMQSDTAAIQSRLLVVEAAIDSDQTSRTTAISAVKSDLVVIEAAVSDVKSELVIISGAVATLDAAIDSDQTSRTTAISDVKSELVIVSAAIATLDAAIDSDQTSRTAAISSVKSDTTAIEAAGGSLTGAQDSKLTEIHGDVNSTYSSVEVIEAAGGSLTGAQDSKLTEIHGDVNSTYSSVEVIEVKTSDTHSRLTLVDAAIDSDQTSRTTALATISTAVATLDAAIDSDQLSRTTAISAVKSDLVVIEGAVSDVKSELVIISGAVATVDAAIDSDQTSRTAALSDIKSDTALLDSAHAEPTGVPAANESILDKIGYLFMALRNRIDITATAKTFYDDSGATEFKKTVSDDDTTYSEGEAESP